MKLLNICAAIALSGMLSMAADAMMSAGKACETEHKQCREAGKSEDRCNAEKDKCFVDVMHGRR